MPFAESNRAALRYIAESTWGTTPASGDTREMRITSSSMVASKETATSDEIRADRMVSNIIETAASSSGDINYEFSAGTVDDFFQAFLLGAWTRATTMDKVEGAIVAVASTSTITITSSTDYTDIFVNGGYVKLEGFADQANNDYHLMTGASAFASGVTTLTIGAADLVVEAGSAYTRILDAEDVIVASSAIDFGLAGANVLDSGGGDVFAAAITAGELVVGQKIWVEGLGYGVGNYNTTGGVPSDGDTCLINDGDKSVTFEFDSDSSVTTGNISVTIGSDTVTVANLVAAVQAQAHAGKLSVTADIHTTTTICNIVNLRDAQGGSVTAPINAGSGAVVDFTGGDTQLHGMKTITALDDDAITVSETLTTDTNTGTITIYVKGSHVRNPGTVADITKQSFTIQTGFTDVGQYFTMTGMRVGSFSMTVAAGEIVGGSFAFSGKETTTGQTDALGATGSYAVFPTTGTEVYNATANVGSVKKDGSSLATAVQSIEINGEAGLREQRAVANKFPAGIGYGRFELSGTLTTYFEDLTMYDHFINHDTIALEWDFTDNDNAVYIFRIPALKITTDPIAPGGIDQDIMEELEWTAQRDAVLNTQFMIDRFSSVYATEAQHAS